MSINIFLHKPDPFYAGEVINGKVICSFNSSKHIKGVLVKLKGEEHTHWTRQESEYDTRTRRSNYTSFHYSGNNTFLNFESKLCGEGTVGFGQYEYPFQFVIPMNIPSSYQGPNGYIRYSLKGRIEIPWSFDSKEEKFLYVIAPINFNTFLSPMELNPVKYEDYSSQFFGLFGKGKVRMEVYLNKIAFVLGESISIRIHITNLSKNSVNQLSVKVKKHIVETCTLPRTDTKYDTKTILQHEDTGVGAHGERTYLIDLRIPNNMDLPNFMSSRLYSISHSLKIQAKISGFQQNMKIEKGITLGHVPLAAPPVYQPMQRPDVPSAPPMYQPAPIPNFHTTNSNIYPIVEKKGDDDFVLVDKV